MTAHPMIKGKPFSFTKENEKHVLEILKKYPEGRQASAILPFLDLAQRQNGGWLSKESLEYVAERLKLPIMHVYEVASFYSMFNFKPVGKYFIQVCTTTPCWLRGSDDVLKACKNHLGDIKPGEVTKDGNFSYREVECLGACANAPMVQINDEYYEDLDEKSMGKILTALRKGESVRIGSQIGRKSSEPRSTKKTTSTPSKAKKKEK